MGTKERTNELGDGTLAANVGKNITGWSPVDPYQKS